MRRFCSVLGYDILFQFRNGFYHAYLFLTVLYVILLRFIPLPERGDFLVLLLFMDNCVLGFFFVGGLMLLEKNDNLFQSLFITPLRQGEYLLSKAVSLGLISLVSSLILQLATMGIPERWFLFSMGILLSSSMFTLLGIAIGSVSSSINDYFARSILPSLVLALPLLPFFGITLWTPFLVFPTTASLLLLQTSYQEIPTGFAFYALLFLLLSNAVVWHWAMSRFKGHILLQKKVRL